MRGVDRISLIMHNAIFKDTSESLCSRAWRLRNQSRFWNAWTHVFGRIHCWRSYARYHDHR